MKSVSIKFPLPMLKIYAEAARASGLDLSTYIRAQLAANAQNLTNIHTIKKD